MPESRQPSNDPCGAATHGPHASAIAAEDGLGREDLALLAHELRGALTAILSLAELVRRGSVEPPSSGGERAVMHDALDGIARAVARADALITDAQSGLVRASRPDRVVDLAHLARTVARDAGAISEREIHVVAPAALETAGDENALSRALANLIDNALKYSLGSSPVEVMVADQGSTATVSVADRGPGIPEGERERVLMPFERLDRHEQIPGTGLGLAVVAQVAENHGGNVTIEDRAGGGAVVALHLPVASSG